MPIIRDATSTDAEINKAADVLHATVQETAAPRATEQAAPAPGPGPSPAEAFARPFPQNPLAPAGTALAQGVQEMSQAWLGLMQEHARRTMDGLNALAGCRSVQEIVTVQGRLVREGLESVVEQNRRLAEISLKMAGDTATAITRQANETTRPGA